MSDSLLAEFAELVNSRMALYFPPSRWNDLGRRACMAAKEFEFEEVEPFLHWVVSTPLDQTQIEVLASHLTVHETYFWREPQAFEALETWILPEIARNQPNGRRRLRIWSAGCSTGEEPYSIAIAILRTIPRAADWDISILATDLNPRMLRKAATGIYSNWSFRNVPPWFTKSYFQTLDGGQHAIRPQIREMVKFAYLNLAEDAFPSFISNTNALDLIFCRNVLMYFAPECARRTVLRFLDCLVKGGWLVVSASELCQPLFDGFRTVRFPGATAYRKDAQGLRSPLVFAKEEFAVPPAPSPIAASWMPAPSPEAATAFAAKTAVPGPVEEPPKAAVPAMAQPDAPPLETQKEELGEGLVRTLANEGKLEEALAACTQALVADKLSLALHFLRATILQELGRWSEAAAALQRALYLQPGFVLAHFMLGTLASNRGDATAAQRCFENAKALLQTYPDDEILPESEGLTVKRFKEIVCASIKAGVPS